MEETTEVCAGTIVSTKIHNLQVTQVDVVRIPLTGASFP